MRIRQWDGWKPRRELAFAMRICLDSTEAAQHAVEGETLGLHVVHPLSAVGESSSVTKSAGGRETS